MTADVLNSTQYGSQFGVNQLNQDGFASGRLSSIDVDGNGVIFARYTNGRSQPLGQVALVELRQHARLAPARRHVMERDFHLRRRRAR